MDIPLTSIHFPKDSRLRQLYGELAELALDLRDNGQLQDILLRPFNPDEYPDAEPKEYVIIDGGRRYLAFKALHAKGIEVPGVEPGCIGSKLRGEETHIRALVLEYQANCRRKDFNWREEAVFIRKLHDVMMEEEPDVWSVKLTAKAIGRSKEWAYKNLHLTESNDIFMHKRIRAADSFVAAYKQYEILKDKARRKAEAEQAEAELARIQAVVGDDDLPSKGMLADPKALARRAHGSVWLGDVRKWIVKQKSSGFDWFHWDPPYGGEQSGGAGPVHEEFDDTEEQAWPLIEATIPEIHRTLKDGAWLAIWYDAPYYHHLMGLLGGHKFVDGRCDGCGLERDSRRFTNLCRKAVHGFWVNPRPFVWYKNDRTADGHEIKRFCVNAYETFLLACKTVDIEPILPRTNRQNVLSFPMVTQKERTHVTHKPVELLAEVLSLISVRGSRGGDGGTGSGSIFEAAFGTGRDMVGVEIAETYYHTSLEAAKRGLQNWGQS